MDKLVVILAFAVKKFSTGAPLVPKFCVPAPNVTFPLTSIFV